MHDALLVLAAGRTWDPQLFRRAKLVLAALPIAVYLFSLVSAVQAYRRLAPLDLPGTAGIHIDGDERARYHWVLQKISQSCDSFISFPAMHSLYLWTGKLPQEHRDAGDEQLLAAFAGGLGLADLASLFAEMYVRARGDVPDQDQGREFADREVKLATTIGGAGVLHGDLTAGCAAAVAAVLDALGAPAGAGDDRTKRQRYHDALAEAMRWLEKCIVTWVT